ncbi:hypothetical protein ACIBAC_19220 [Streptomyces sp. NPDC051362]|uniref:phosphorylase family protein n=1 Tax=Streptomyces sp. NPDC051362 TaxID=3365651 RepID=UPI0037BD31D3
MQLIGEIRSDRPLFVAAAPEEIAHMNTDCPGMGKVNAALAVIEVLSASIRPSEVINIGTAGALADGMCGIYEVSCVIQHDLDSQALLNLKRPHLWRTD